MSHVFPLHPSGKHSETSSNPWITGGTLGSKDAVLVFRTCVLSSQYDSESETGPSASSSLSNISSNTKDDNSLLPNVSKVFASLPKNLTSQRGSTAKPLGVFERLLHETKSKKRQLESSSSSSSLSNTSCCSGGDADVDNELATLPEEEADAKKPTASNRDDNKENVTDVVEKSEMPSATFNITYKFINTETRLLRKILLGHGLTEQTVDSNDFSLLWTGIHLKPDILRNLLPFQRVNHFPR
jgi:tubulin polyglutamylase TTLL5